MYMSMCRVSPTSPMDGKSVSTHDAPPYYPANSHKDSMYPVIFAETRLYGCESYALRDVGDSSVLMSPDYDL